MAFDIPTQQIQQLVRRASMNKVLLPVAALCLLTQAPAFAIDAKYSQKLENSGCTQLSELQGCDINKSKAENAKAGFVTEAPAKISGKSTPVSQSPYSGNWVAVGPDGSSIVAKIHIDSNNQVTVNGTVVKSKLSEGGLIFKQDGITFMIQGDRRLKGKDYWNDSDAKTTGKIVTE